MLIAFNVCLMGSGSVQVGVLILMNLFDASFGPDIDTSRASYWSSLLSYLILQFYS